MLRSPDRYIVRESPGWGSRFNAFTAVLSSRMYWDRSKVTSRYIPKLESSESSYRLRVHNTSIINQTIQFVHIMVLGVDMAYSRVVQNVHFYLHRETVRALLNNEV